MTVTNRDLLTDNYDLRAYEHIMKSLEPKSGALREASGRARKAIGSAGKKVVEKVPAPAQEVMTTAMSKAMDGFRVLIVEPSFRSVMISKVEKKYRQLGHPVASLDDVPQLPLRVIDKAMPPLGLTYAATMGVEGAVAGGVVTGAELIALFGTTASAGAAAGPGAGAVAGAIAVDAAAVLGASMRVIAHVGAYFGRDASLPEEQAFALSVANWSTSVGDSAKVLAFQQLSKLTQQLIRGAAWKRLEEHGLVVALNKAMTAMGFQMTKRKLGQAVPLLGVAIGAGLNAQILHSAARDAVTAYRLRHLIEQYGLNPGEFGAVAREDEDVVEVLGEIEKGTEEL